MSQYIQENFTLQTFPEFVESHLNNHPKKKHYLDNFGRMLPKASTFERYTVISKPYEKQMGSFNAHDEARVVCSPNRFMLVHGIWANHILLTALKHCEQDQALGLNDEQLAQRMSEDLHELRFYGDIETIAMDGSRHDAHQHWQLIEAADAYVINLLAPVL